MQDLKKTSSHLSEFNLNIQDWLDSPFHVYLKDKKGLVLECNIGQAKSCGFEKIEDVIGARDLDFISPEEGLALRVNDDKVILAGTSQIFVEKATFANVTTNNVLLSLKGPLRDKANKIIGIFGASIPMNNPAINMADTVSNAFAQLGNVGISVSPEQAFKISKREHECLVNLRKGLTTKEIARVLQLSPRTIEFYIENIKKKFSCTKRTELIAKAAEYLR